MKKILRTLLAISMASSVGHTFESSQVSTVFTIAQMIFISASTAVSSDSSSSSSEKKHLQKQQELKEAIEIYNSTGEFTNVLRSQMDEIRSQATEENNKDIQSMTDAQLVAAIDQTIEY